VEDVRSVFEGSSVLSCIGSQKEGRVRRSIDPEILGNGRVISIVGPVKESTSWVGHIWESVFSGRNVVSHSQDTVAVSVSDASLIFGSRKGPVVVVVVSRLLSSVTQVVFSGEGSKDAIRWVKSPCWFVDPFIGSSLRAYGFIVGGNLDSRVGFILAISLGLDVLGFGLVEVTPVSVGCEDGDILPFAWVPVRIIISFFGALKSVSVSVVVLSGVDSASSSSGQTSFSCSVCNVQSHISLSGVAVEVVLETFVHSV